MYLCSKIFHHLFAYCLWSGSIIKTKLSGSITAMTLKREWLLQPPSRLNSGHILLSLFSCTHESGINQTRR